MAGKFKNLKALASNFSSISSATQNFLLNKSKYLPEAFLQAKPKSSVAQEAPKNCEFSIGKKEHAEKVLKFMETDYLDNEPVARSFKIGRQDYDTVLKPLMLEDYLGGLTILAKKNDEIAGVCISQRCCHWYGDHLEKMSCDTDNLQVRKYLQLIAFLHREPRIHQKLGEDVIFNIAHLSVSKNFKNQGIGKDLMKKSLALARDANYNYAKVICTNMFTQKICDKIGMTPAWNLPYKNILSEETCKPLILPDDPHTHAHVYYVDLKQLPNDFTAFGLN